MNLDIDGFESVMPHAGIVLHGDAAFALLAKYRIELAGATKTRACTWEPPQFRWNLLTFVVILKSLSPYRQLWCNRCVSFTSVVIPYVNSSCINTALPYD